MAFRLLFDEMIEANFADYCSKLGHDVERVVEVPELGTGSDDVDIVAYAERENRILVTYDDDFLTDDDTLDRIGVLFGVDDRLPPFESANVVDTIAEYVDQKHVVTLDEPIHITTDWTAP